jgi:large subunit ribosomal protein L18
MSKLRLSQRRRARIRSRIHGTATRPRLVVHLSLTQTRAQLIDDEAGRTLASASEQASDAGTKTERATLVGERLGEAAKAAGVTRIVFDRAGHPFRGRTKAVAEAARAKGLEF